MVAAGFLLASCGVESAPRADDDVVRALTPESFDQAIASGVVLVDFWADW